MSDRELLVILANVVEMLCHQTENELSATRIHKALVELEAEDFDSRIQGVEWEPR